MSSQLAQCRLLVHEPAPGAWNMAVDEALLADVATSGVPVLRFYQWEQPTLSLGYFQQHTERSKHPASQLADLVRRLSGGGAILHDHELTYSLILPASHPLAKETQTLYDTVHQTIALELNNLLEESSSSWRASLCEPASTLEPHEEPFLCFQRRAKGDILLSPRNAVSNSPTHKVVGSAQRRQRGTVLQHGSILTRQSELAPELPGIEDMGPPHETMQRLLTNLPTAIAESLHVELVDYEFTSELHKQAQEIQERKYASQAWAERR